MQTKTACIPSSSVYDEGWMLSVYVTFLTISYHFSMRLIVGEAVTLIYRKRNFNLDSAGFRIHRFEKDLYRRLNVKKWKLHMITGGIGPSDQFIDDTPIPVMVGYLVPEMLVVYCLKDVSITATSHGLSELIAGVVVYMLLIRCFFKKGYCYET